jgi:hypothetical protein
MENIRMIFPRAWKQFFGLIILKFFAVDPRDLFDPGSGMENFGSGILDNHSGYAAMILNKLPLSV